MSAKLNTPLRRFKVEIFQALAHPTRIAIVEVLVGGELAAGAISAKLGVEQSNVSQHLAILRANQVVTNRKAGNQVYYAIRDPIITSVLELMRTYFFEHLREVAGMMGEMDEIPESAAS